MDIWVGCVLGFTTGWVLTGLLLGAFQIRLKRIGWAFACYMIVWLLLSAYSSQRHCYGEGSGCVVKAGALWPFDLIWAGARFVTMPRDLHLPTIKWN